MTYNVEQLSRLAPLPDEIADTPLRDELRRELVEHSATVTIPRARLKALEGAAKALEPFAEAADNYADCNDTKYVDNDATITVGNLREGRKALAALRAAGITGERG